MGAIKWHKTFFAQLATPLAVRDLVNAFLAFVVFRVASACGVFMLVLAPFGVFESWWGPVLAWLARHGRSAGARAALERRAEQGRIPYDFMRLSPHFTAWSSDPRFTRALTLARGQFEDALQVLKEAEARGELPSFLRQPLTDLLRTLGMNPQVGLR